MQAFQQAYPWMVLMLGFAAVLITIFGSVVIAAGLWFDVASEFVEKVAPSAFALVVGQVLAVLVLVAVRWLLTFS